MYNIIRNIIEQEMEKRPKELMRYMAMLDNENSKQIIYIYFHIYIQEN